MPVEANDTELVRKTLCKDDKAFATLVQKYSPYIYRLALSIVKNDNLAQEVLQLSFIQIYKKLNTWRGENFKSWISIITKHIALRMLENETNADPIDESQHYTQDEEPDNDHEKLLCTLEKAIEALSQEEKDLVHLFYYQKMPQKDIAKKYNTTENNISVRLSRIRDKLKKLINKINEHEE